MPVVEHFINVENYRIRVKSGNEKNKKKVVLLHGMSFTADTWDNLGTLDVLYKANLGVFALDMPGFGKSRGKRLNRHIAADVLKHAMESCTLKERL